MTVNALMMSNCCTCKLTEQRCRMSWTALKLWVCLACNKPRVNRLWKLNHLYKAIVWRNTRNYQTSLNKLITEYVAYLIAVTMTLVNQVVAICLVCKSSLNNLTRIRTKAHGTALVSNILLIRHKIDDRVWSIWTKLC